MNVEWDARKAAINLARHRVDFADAARIFDDRVVGALDRRTDYGEDRWIAIGVVDGRELVVVYTVRNGVYRLISAWRATRHEREAYWQERSRHDDA